MKFTLKKMLPLLIIAQVFFYASCNDNDNDEMRAGNDTQQLFEGLPFYQIETTDITEINQKIKEISNQGGGTIYLPNDRILCRPSDTNRHLQLKKNIKLIGNNKTEFFVEDNTGKYYALCTCESQENIVLDGITFNYNVQGNKSNFSHETIQSGDTRKLLELNGKNMIIQNCKFFYSGVHAIAISGAWNNQENIWIQNNLIQYDYPGDDDVEYDNTAIYVDTPLHYIQNNTIIAKKTEQGGRFGYGGIETHSSMGVVNGNNIDGFRTGIHITGYDHKEGSNASQNTGNNLLSVTSNNIKNSLIGIELWGYQVEDKSLNLTGVVISNNNIDLTYEGWIFKWPGSSVHHMKGISFNDNANMKFQQIEIASNTINFPWTTDFINDESYSNRAKYIESYGIGASLYSAKIINVNIANNIISNSMKQGIAFESNNDTYVSSINIIGNTFINTCLNGNVHYSYRCPVMLIGNVSCVNYANNIIREERAPGQMLTFAEFGCDLNASSAFPSNCYVKDNYCTSEFIGKVENAFDNVRAVNTAFCKEPVMRYFDTYENIEEVELGDLLVLKTPHEGKTLFKVERAGNHKMPEIEVTVLSDNAIVFPSYNEINNFPKKGIVYTTSHYAHGHIAGYDMSKNTIYLSDVKTITSGNDITGNYPPIITGIQ